MVDIQVALLDELETTFQPLTMVDIGAVAEALDVALPRFLLEYVTESAGQLIAGATPSYRAPGMFTLNERTYRVSIGPSMVEPDLLTLAVLSHETDAPRARNRQKTKRLEGFWKYHRIRLHYPAALDLDVDRLLQAGGQIYETASRWLQQQVSLAISDKAISCEKLYGTLRSVVPNDALANTVWFVAEKDKRGFFLLDRNVVNDAIGRVAEKAPNVDKSSFELAAEMITMYLSFEIMLVKDAVKAGCCIVVDLKNESKYATSDPDLLDAELAIHGGQYLAIYPIELEGKSLLFAVFPARHRETLEPVFELHRDRFARQFRRFSSRLHRLLAQLSHPRPFIDRAQAGEFVGGVITGAVKRFIE